MKYNRDYNILICGVILIAAILFFQANITAITSDLYDTGVQKVPEYLKTPANITNQVILPYTVKSISPNIMVEQNKTNRMVTLDFVTGTGSSGGIGLNGSQGPAGPQGAQGIQGPQGAQGIQGPAGINGINGTNGLPGINGTNGINGSQGPQGSQGIQGPAGINGINGSQGPQGVQGTNGSFNISKGITLQTNYTLAAWSRKKPIYINNTGNSNLSNFQVKMNISYNTDMNIDFSDIRFFNEFSGINVSYWIESKVNSSYANIWINLSSLPGSVWSNNTFYIYYGNPSAVSASNGTNTFNFFDDFNSLDWSKWESTNQALYSVTSGKMTSTPAGALTQMLNTKNSFNNIIFEIKAAPTFSSRSISFFGLVSSKGAYTGTDNTYTDQSGPQQHDAVVGSVVAHSGVNTVNGEYLRHVLKFPNSGNVTFSIYRISDNSLLVTKSGTPTESRTSYLEMFTWISGTTEYDWVFVRKYTATEPTTATGQEVEISDLWCLQLSNQGNLITSKGACV